MLIFVGLITSTENVQKNVECDFCNQWSNSFILKSFYQIPLTWSKTYHGETSCLLIKIESNAKEQRKDSLQTTPTGERVLNFTDNPRILATNLFFLFICTRTVRLKEVANKSIKQTIIFKYYLVTA